MIRLPSVTRALRWLLATAATATPLATMAGLLKPANIAGVDTGDTLSMIKWVIVNYGQIAIVAIGAIVFVGVGYYVAKSFFEAVKKKEWEGMISTVIGGVVVLVIVAGLLIMGWSYISDLTAAK